MGMEYFKEIWLFNTSVYTFNIHTHRNKTHFYTPPHKKWRGIILSELWASVRPSVCLSALRFHALTLVAFDLFSSNWGVVWDCKWANFVLKQQSYGPWCMSKMLCASFPCSNFSTFLPIFFKLCIDSTGKEWYGIASGIISFRNNRVMAFDLFLLNILRMNRRISIKFCICI